MQNLKQHLIDEIAGFIANKEREAKESDDELAVLNAKRKVEEKALTMDNLKEELREDFVCSVQVVENMIAMEESRNQELKKDLEMLKYRKAVIESQFSGNELDR